MISYDDLNKAIFEMEAGEQLTVIELFNRAASQSTATMAVYNSLMDSAAYFKTDPEKAKLARNQLAEIVTAAHGPKPVVRDIPEPMKLSPPVREEKPKPEPKPVPGKPAEQAKSTQLMPQKLTTPAGTTVKTP